MCVQKEERLLVEQRKKMLFTLPGSEGKNNDKNKGNGKTQPKSSIKKESMCFFYKNKGHMKDCAKQKVWLEKKSTSFSFICYESNFTNVNHNTWWIDSGSTIHVSNTLQSMRNLRKPVGSEQYIHSRGRSSSHVEAIGTCSLKLLSGFVLQLENTFYVPSFSRNLFSILALIPIGISCNFKDTGFTLLIKSEVIGYGILCDGLYFVQLQDNNAYNSLSLTVGIKRSVMNEESSILWHRRLGHITIQRIKRLVKEGVLSSLEFTDFETCLNCIKGKQTNKSKKGATRNIC